MSDRTYGYGDIKCQEHSRVRGTEAEGGGRGGGGGGQGGWGGGEGGAAGKNFYRRGLTLVILSKTMWGIEIFLISLVVEVSLDGLLPVPGSHHQGLG